MSSEIGYCGVLPVTFSKEELIRAYENGTLESLLLGHGMLPFKALEYLLSELILEDA